MQRGHLGGAYPSHEESVAIVAETVLLSGVAETYASDRRRAEAPQCKGLRPAVGKHPQEAAEAGLQALPGPHRLIRPRQA